MTQKETAIDALIERLEQAIEYAEDSRYEFVELYREEVEDCIELLHEYKELQT